MSVQQLLALQTPVSVPRKTPALQPIKDIFEDTATHLPHHVMLLPQLEVLLSEDCCLGLIVINVEGLDPIEEIYGGDAHQQIVAQVSRCLRRLQGSVFRTNDLLAVSELGGASFMIFLTNHRGEEKGSLTRTDVQAVAERVRERVFVDLIPILHDFGAGLPKLSVGESFVVFNPLVRRRRLINKLIEESRDKTRLDRSHLSQKYKERLEQILANQDIRTVFQPIWSLSNHRLVGVEALSRGPEGTILETPLILFSLAEKAGLAYELDRICRQKALSRMRELPPGYKMFVNVLPKAIQDPNLPEELRKCTQDHFLSAASELVLEISEREAIVDSPTFQTLLQKMLAQGVSFAVDDMGVGHSCLDTLVRIRPGFMKLDMSLVQGICDHPVRKDMLQMFVHFARRIDAKLVAEGIETQDDFELLREMKVDYGQGYLLARPMPMSEIQKLFAHTTHKNH